MSSSGTIVLGYHRVGREPIAGRDPDEMIYVLSKDVFEAQMELVALSQIKVLDLDSVDSFKEDVSEPSLALTFDDGNASDYTHALPVLLRHGLTAAFFVSPQLVGGEGYLSWDQIRELRAAGMTIGAHGLDHSWLADLPDEQLVYQLREAKQRLETELDESIDTISLPGGSSNAHVVSRAHEHGYRLVFSSVPIRYEGQLVDGTLPRLALRDGENLKRFKRLIEHSSIELGRHSFRYRCVTFMRRVLGERFYQGIRNKLLVAQPTSGRM